MQHSHPFSFLDALTGATALEHNLILVMPNTRNHPVEGLKV